MARPPPAAVTRDGRHVEVTANVASLQEVEQSLTLGGEGVGLLRSEFLYLERNRAAERRGAGRHLQRHCPPPSAPNEIWWCVPWMWAAIKPLAYVPMDSETNPFLGLRGIRLCLERPELLREQLRAILASAGLARLVSCCRWSACCRSCAWRAKCSKRKQPPGLSELPSWAS